VKIIKLLDLTKEKNSLEEKKKTPKVRKRLREIEAEMIPLQTFLDEAKRQREQIKKEIGIRYCPFHSNVLASLKYDFEKCVLVVDFTKFGLVDSGNVHCFIVAVLSSSDANNKLYKNCKGITDHFTGLFLIDEF
jgi:hypothetical protein